MTTRERRIAAGAGGFVVLLAAGAVAYLAVWSPLQDKRRQAEQLLTETGDKQVKLAKIRKDMARLDVALKRSLPADVDVARLEYDAAITKLLRDAKVPTASVSVKPKPVETKTAPELSPRRPAFVRVGLDVTLTKVSLGTVVDVLTRYYKLNLLQQITNFTLKRADESGRETAGPIFGSLVADRADLVLTFVTEAVVLDGAEPRRSLLPVSLAYGMVGGGAGLHAILNSPQPARGLAPMQLARVLAANDRDYSLVLVKDFFHGPPPPAVVREVVVKEDTSPFIRVTGVGRNPDGSGAAVIEDLAAKQEYKIDLRWVSNKLTPEVTKFYYSIKGAKKSYDAEPGLDISESSSATVKKFRVIGFADEGLVVAESRAGAERVYHWGLGKALSQIKELTGAAKDKAVRVAQGLPEAPDLAPEPKALDAAAEEK